MFKFAALIVALIAFGSQVVYHTILKEPVGDESRRNLTIDGSEIEFERLEGNFVTKIKGNDVIDVIKGLGYAHARDRGVQLFLLRTIAQGRLSELLASTDDTLKIDQFMRRAGFATQVEKAIQEADKEIVRKLQAYSSGVNALLKEGRLPLEFVLTRFNPEPWKPSDSLLILRLMMFVGLAEQQERCENFIVNLLQTDNGLKLAKRLFPTLEQPSEELLDIIRKLKVEEFSIFPPNVKIMEDIPKITASNNWAVSPKKSASGNALYASDPHLNVVQLPPIWYEAILETKDNYMFGVSVPGTAIAMGRTKDVALGFTYGFMDLIDYFIEKCKGFECEVDGKFVPLNSRKEIIQRKGNTSIEITFYETKHGELQIKEMPKEGLKEGYYVSRGYAHDVSGGWKSLHYAWKALESKSVKEAQGYLKNVDLSANFIIVDRDGNIGFQQSGSLPIRKITNGLLPRLGWKSEYDWKGIVPGDDLYSDYNPESGFLASANDEWNPKDKQIAVSLHMGYHRVNRIRDLLQAKEKLDLEDFKEMQSDLFSYQARDYMEIIKPLLPRNNPVADLLKNWDMKYTEDSKGAVLFEELWLAILDDVYNRILGLPDKVDGKSAWEHVSRETPIVMLLHHYFDKVILDYSPSDDELLWKGESRDSFFSRMISKVINKYDNVTNVATLRKSREIYMQNIFFNGKLGIVGKGIGYDIGPYVVPGSRGTIAQGTVAQLGGRIESFAPSWRFVTDVNEDTADTILPGGVSDQLFSGLYSTDLEKWSKFQYKKVTFPNK